MRLLAAAILYAVPTASAAGQRARVAPRPPARTAPAASAPAYTNAEYHFTFSPPPGWVPKQNRDAVCLFMEQSASAQSAAALPHSETTAEFLARMKRKQRHRAESTKFRANITITVVKAVPVRSLEEYVSESRALAARRKAYRIVSEKPVTLGGVPAVERSVRVTLPDGTTTRNREVICFKDGSLLTVALASAPDSVARNSAAFDRALATFRWTR